MNPAVPFLDNFSCSMFVKDLQGTYIWVNKTLLKKHRLNSKDILGKKDEQLPWRRHAKYLKLHDEEILDVKEIKVFQETASRQGTMVKGICQKSLFKNDSGVLIGTSGVWIDVPILNPLFQNLSLRERQCFEDVIAGKSAKETAYRLKISPRTVETYIEHLKEKLQCKNKKELIIKYFES